MLKIRTKIYVTGSDKKNGILKDVFDLCHSLCGHSEYFTLGITATGIDQYIREIKLNKKTKQGR